MHRGQRVAGWLLLALFACGTLFFNYFVRRFGFFGVTFSLYVISILIFLNVGVLAVENWRVLSLYDYKKCLLKIYDGSSPRFLFSFEEYKCAYGDYLVGAAALSYFLLPIVLYGKIEGFIDRQSRYPLAMLVALAVHVQIGTTFELIVWIVKRRSK
ncbi:hypothetical protein [Pseudomonas sp. Q1-7]|uniref:hypothetical protein n=1 Tax=Pseudomonas sp. Q1-7 TaxID=3020843 RepID=UPI00230024E7|nr:hypothetical protein [Pseudomonas sp. Q1-7]